MAKTTLNLPRTRRLTARQEEILEGARDILEQGVYSDLTVDALARALKMSKSTLYKYFRGKDDLICAMVIQICEDLITSLERIVARSGPLSSPKRLHAAIDVVAHHVDLLPRAVLLQMDRLPETCRDHVGEGRLYAEQALQKILQDGMDRQELEVESPAVAAAVIMAAMNAAALGSARGDHSLPRAEAAKIAYRMLAPGLGLAASPTASA